MPAGGPGILPGGPAAPPRPGAATGPARIPGVEEGGPLGELRIVADETTNAVIVTAYPRAWKEIESTIKQLDKAPRQVLVEVIAAEVTLTDDFRLGVEWAVRAGRFDFVSTTEPGTSSAPNGPSRACPPPCSPSPTR